MLGDGENHFVVSLLTYKFRRHAELVVAQSNPTFSWLKIVHTLSEERASACELYCAN